MGSAVQLSVVVPVYNVVDFLAASLESVLSQPGVPEECFVAATP